MTKSNDVSPGKSRMIATHLMCIVLGAVVSGVLTHLVMEKQGWNRWQLENRHRKGALAKLAAETLARLRTGDVDEALPYLEDTVDRYMVGVPMGEDYSALDDRCQSALATCKVYRSRIPFRLEWCKWCGPEGGALHFKHAPSLLSDVPLLAADHEWLNGPMRRVREMPAAPATSEVK